MNTFLEYITLIKGVEYLIAITFLFIFILFWQVLHYKGKGLILRIIPLMVITIGFGTLTYTCALPQSSSVRAELKNETPLLSSPVLVEMYGPASFDHDQHQLITQNCTVCHHNSESETPPCKNCHADSFNPDDLNKPGITHVYHLRCISCHTENQKGPTECVGCHNKAAIPPLSIAHPLAGAENCLSCHGDSIAGVPELPADHNCATNGVCQLCHHPGVQEGSLAKGKLPHEVSGRENCLICHGEGISGAAKVPADHSGRTNDTCQLCHKS